MDVGTAVGVGVGGDGLRLPVRVNETAGVGGVGDAVPVAETDAEALRDPVRVADPPRDQLGLGEPETVCDAVCVSVTVPLRESAAPPEGLRVRLRDADTVPADVRVGDAVRVAVCQRDRDADCVTENEAVRLPVADVVRVCAPVSVRVGVRDREGDCVGVHEAVWEGDALQVRLAAAECDRDGVRGCVALQVAVSARVRVRVRVALPVSVTLTMEGECVEQLGLQLPVCVGVGALREGCGVRVRVGDAREAETVEAVDVPVRGEAVAVEHVAVPNAVRLSVRLWVRDALWGRLAVDDRERVGRVAEALRSGVSVQETVDVAVAVREALPVRLSEREAVGDAEGVREGVRVAVRLPRPVGVAVRLRVSDALVPDADALRDRVREKVAVGARVRLCVRLPEAVPEERVCEGVRMAVRVGLRVAVGDDVAVALPDGVREADCVDEGGEPVVDIEGEGLSVWPGVRVRDVVDVHEGVCEGVGERLREIGGGVPEPVAVRLWLRLGRGVGVELPVREGLGLRERVAPADADPEAVAEREALALAVEAVADGGGPEGLWVGLGDGPVRVAEGDGLAVEVRVHVRAGEAEAEAVQDRDTELGVGEAEGEEAAVVVRVALGVALQDAVTLPDTEVLRETLREACESEGLREVAVGVAVVVRCHDSDGVGDAVGDGGDAERDSDGVNVRVGRAESVRDGLGGDGVDVGVGVAEAVRVAVELGLEVQVRVPVAEGGVRLRVHVRGAEAVVHVTVPPEIDRGRVRVGVQGRVWDGVAVQVPDVDADAVGVALGGRLHVSVSVSDAERVRVRASVRVPEAEALGVPVGVRSDVGLQLKVCVPVLGVLVREALAVSVCAGDEDRERVWLRDDTEAETRETEAEPGRLAVSERVRVCVGVHAAVGVRDCEGDVEGVADWDAVVCEADAEAEVVEVRLWVPTTLPVRLGVAVVGVADWVPVAVPDGRRLQVGLGLWEGVREGEGVKEGVSVARGVGVAVAEREGDGVEDQDMRGVQEVVAERVHVREGGEGRAVTVRVGLGEEVSEGLGVGEMVHVQLHGGVAECDPEGLAES